MTMNIHVQNLTKEYVSQTALWDLSLAVECGESVGLVGSNGAGKTTLISILIGFLPFDRGEASILGKSSAEMDGATRERIGFVPEETGLLPWATLSDLAGLYATLYHRWDRRMLDRFIDEWEIATEKRIRSMSRGQKRLAELALCFSTCPEILLLDEPFDGLDAVMRIRVMDVMREMNRRQGTTLFYSSHILSEIGKIAERLIVLREGEIHLDGKIADLDSSVDETFTRLYDLESGEEVE